MSWQDLHGKFMQLASEEQGRADVITKGKVLQGMDRVLRASCSYEQHPEGWERGKPEQGLICLLHTPPHGVWNYCSDGISENFFERVRLCVAQAGRALSDYPKGTDLEDYWLHRLYLDLRENDSDLLFCASKKGGMILSICVASATFCSRLERQALAHSQAGGNAGDDRLRTNAKQTESSPAQNSGKTVQAEASVEAGIRALKAENAAKLPEPGTTAQGAKRKTAIRNRTKTTPPQQAPARTKRRARSVARLLRELRAVKPRIHNEKHYAQVAREHSNYLLFRIARKDGDVKQWIENVQDRRGLVGLAQEIAARHHRVSLATIKTDWSHRRVHRQPKH
jgi:hypothetical protein